MKNILISTAAATVLVFSPLTASARASGSYSGAVVESINSMAMTVTFRHGATHGYSPAALAAQLQPGMMVDFRWQDINGSSVVTSAFQTK